MTGKTYQRGVNNLCYRGTGYTLNEVVTFGDAPYEMGVVNLNIDTLVQVQAPDEGQEEYFYARQQIDHPDGHKRTFLVLEAHQAHQEQVLHDQG